MASKGKSAFGKEFFTGMEQVILYGNDRSRMNYQISVMATKDNTHVKLSNYSEGIIFADGSKPTELNFTLNRGQSYLIVQEKSDVDPQMQFDDYEPDLIGAKVTSDKPIVVNNGNISSHYFGEGGADFTLDQALPTSKIGKEYFLVTGMTPAKWNENIANAILPTERALIIATKDNTKIYFNDESFPTKTLNAGERFFTLPYTPPKYIKGDIPAFTNALGKVIYTSGMYIHTSEPVYVYQLIGGLWDRIPKGDRTVNATGLLLSYPIDKNYLSDPRQKLENLVQIPFVNQIGYSRFETKVSVKAPTNANVKINGFTPSKSRMIGKDGWSYFTAPLLGGTVNVTSDVGINVDVVGGKPATGFGSSYTAFSNDPFILVNGNCVEEGVFLSLNNIDFDGFQWQTDGVNIPGATDSTYSPTLPGNYTCVLFYQGFTFTTDKILVIACPYKVSTKELGDVCPVFLVETKFSAPNENLPIVKTEILTQPQKGKVTLNNGILNVSMNAGFTGKDRFVYKITAANGFYEVVKVEFNTLNGPIADVLSELRPKNVANTTYYYDLLSAIVNSNNENFTFYQTLAEAEAESNPFSTPGNYGTTNPTEVYVRVQNNNGCFVIKKINLLLPEPVPNDGNLFPNFFTPNGDGFNDKWDYSVLQLMENVQLQIFDRYGNLIFTHTSSNISFMWDGLGTQRTKLKTQTLWVVYSYFDPIVKKMYQGTQWVLLKNL